MTSLQRDLRRAYHVARQQRALRRLDQGDFDDLGRERVARAYHYNQARKRGCFVPF